MSAGLGTILVARARTAPSAVAGMAQHRAECTRSAYTARGSGAWVRGVGQAGRAGRSGPTAYGGSCAGLTRSPSTSAMNRTSHRWEGLREDSCRA